MKFTATALVGTLALVHAAPQQLPFRFHGQDLPTSYPGIDLDLSERRLVQFGDDIQPVWITELEKIEAKIAGKHFFDITDHPDFTSSARVQPLVASSYPHLNASEAVFKTISLLNIEEPVSNLKTFTAFRTRYYRSDTGKQSEAWLLGKVADITNQYASHKLSTRISISEFKHSWGQNTIIAKVAGSAPHGTVIISAHQDSTNMWPFLPAPGADDDGSGTVTILEAYRALLESNSFDPVNDIEFHWYSAEEGGLLGSQAVAKEYAAKKAKVLAQIQFDMTAYVKKGTKQEVGVITDFVEPELVKFVKTLIDEYLDIPWVETLCKYACSDHASWTKAGYPSAFAIESSFENSNHNIHSTGDIMDIPEFSFPHLMEFAKLSVAFAIELSTYKP